MAFTLPIGESTDSLNRISLDGITYDFRTRYNELSGCWYLYVGFTGLDPAAKIKLVVGWELLEPYQATLGVPQGSLWLVDNDTVTGRVDYDNVGQGEQFELLYISVGEVIPDLSEE